MSTLYRRGKTWYIKFMVEQRKTVMVDDEPRVELVKVEVRRSLGVTRKVDAQRLQRAKDAQLLDQRLGIADEKDLLYKTAWRRYADHMKTRKKASTLETERVFWFQFWEDFEGAPETLYEVDQQTVLRWQKVLREGTEDRKANTPVSVNNKIRQVGTVFNWLKRIGEYDGENPFHEVERLDEGAKRTRFVEWCKVLELLDAAKADDPDLHKVVILAALAGLRRGELLEARWSWVDWERKLLWIGGVPTDEMDFSAKTAAGNSAVPLHDELHKRLSEYRAKAGYIVKPGNRPGRSKYRYYYRRKFDRVKAGVGLEKTTTHMLRHSVATHLLDLGYTLAEIAAFLRQSSVRSSERYADIRGVGLKIDRF